MEKAMSRSMSPMMTFATKDPTGMLEVSSVLKNLDKK